MRMVIEFDCDADIVDVPEFVIKDRELYKKRFWKWLSNKSTKHKYWVDIEDKYGKRWRGLRYRSDAFIEWLNKKVLVNTEFKATVLEQQVWDYSEDLPSIFF